MNSTLQRFAILIWCFSTLNGCSPTDPQPIEQRVRMVYIVDDIGTYDTILCSSVVYPNNQNSYVTPAAYITKSGDSAVFVDSNLSSITARVYAIRVTPPALDYPIDTVISNIRPGESYYVRFDAKK